MKKADIILKSNAIFDSVSDVTFKGFVAVLGNRILAVGRAGGRPAGDNVTVDAKDIENYMGSDTKVYDLGNKMVMPGFHDSHVHLIFSGMDEIYPTLYDAKSEEECCQKLLDFIRQNPVPEDEWIVGQGWYQVLWDDSTFPTRASLDKYFPDRPVFLLNAEGHSAWVNTKALKIAGVTKDTPDPYGGYFGRDENGELTGFLCESAIASVEKLAYNLTPKKERQLTKLFIDKIVPFGITSINDLMPTFHGNMGSVKTYSDLDKEGELTVRIHCAPNLLGDLDEVLDWQKKYTSDKVKVTLLKQFLDGVASTHTALMVDDYSDAPGNKGIPLANLEAVRNAVQEAHQKGFSVKLHACGDYSVRLALDYFEEAIEKYGKNKCRHTIEHLEIVDPKDIPRFGELGIIPSIQPEHLAEKTFEDSVYPEKLGPERISWIWQTKSILDSASVVAIGSDCPVVPINPFLEIFRAVTRVHDDGRPEGGWFPHEKLSMAEVLRGYTYGSAYGVSREHELGTLEAGKFADIAVIDRNLFDLESDWDILDSKVCMTIMDGKIIYEDLSIK